MTKIAIHIELHIRSRVKVALRNLDPRLTFVRESRN